MKNWDTVEQYESAASRERNNHNVIYNEKF